MYKNQLISVRQLIPLTFLLRIFFLEEYAKNLSSKDFNEISDCEIIHAHFYIFMFNVTIVMYILNKVLLFMFYYHDVYLIWYKQQFHISNLFLILTATFPQTAWINRLLKNWSLEMEICANNQNDSTFTINGENNKLSLLENQNKLVKNTPIYNNKKKCSLPFNSGIHFCDRCISKSVSYFKINESFTYSTKTKYLTVSSWHY